MRQSARRVGAKCGIAALGCLWSPLATATQPRAAGPHADFDAATCRTYARVKYKGTAADLRYWLVSRRMIDTAFNVVDPRYFGTGSQLTDLYGMVTVTVTLCP